MSSFSPSRSAKDTLRFSSKNFRNHRLHHALDEAKNYSEYIITYPVWSMSTYFGLKRRITYFPLQLKLIKEIQ